MVLPVYGTAVYDTDRYPVLEPVDLLQEPPQVGRGHLIGLDDWRYAVEILLPEDSTSVYDIATYDSSTYNYLSWHDLTPYCRGESWTRGADEPYGRPRVGELNVELDNTDGRWSPFNDASPEASPAYMGPGTLIRVSVHSPTHALRWIPQITCVIDSWSFSTVGKGADKRILVHGWETLRELASIDENALSGVVGLGDNAAERIERLLDAAGWPYGLKVDAENLVYPPDVSSGFWELQSTDMAVNRLAECYLAADSSDVVFRTDRSGAALVCSPWYFNVVDGADPDVWPLVTHSSDFDETIPQINFDYFEHRETGSDGGVGFDVLYVPYDADTIDIVSEDAYIVNDCRFTREGSTQQVHEHEASITRYGRRTYVRSDLQCRYDSTTKYLAYIAGVRQGLQSLRIDRLDVSTSDRGDDVFLAMMLADIGCNVGAYAPDGQVFTGPRPFRVRGEVRSMTHRVQPRTASEFVTWETSLALNTWYLDYLPAAQLPATPLP